MGEGGTRRKGKGVPQADVVAKDDTSPATGAAATPTIPAANFIITPDMLPGEGAEAEKFSDNLAAIGVRKIIEANARAGLRIGTAGAPASAAMARRDAKNLL